MSHPFSGHKQEHVGHRRANLLTKQYGMAEGGNVRLAGDVVEGAFALPGFGKMGRLGPRSPEQVMNAIKQSAPGNAGSNIRLMVPPIRPSGPEQKKRGGRIK